MALAVDFVRAIVTHNPFIRMRYRFDAFPKIKMEKKSKTGERLFSKAINNNRGHRVNDNTTALWQHKLQHIK